MFSWLSKQMELQSAQWGQALQNFYPQYQLMWSDPEEHLKAHQEIWNYREATSVIPWGEITRGKDLIALDLGCGTGWLSALLSKFDSVNTIYALDADKNLLQKMLPSVTKALDGNLKKIVPIHGLFSPLPVDDNSYDLIVSSSALHYAPCLLDALKELYRVLTPEGTLVILNETPPTFKRWIELLELNLGELIQELNTKQFKEYHKQFSSSGILIDPYLGDMVYSNIHWDFVLTRSGFTYIPKNSGLPPYKPSFQASNSDTVLLQHFICTKNPEKSNAVSCRNRMIINSVKDFTMVPEVRILNTINSVEYILSNNIAGAFVECGVWRGGNSMSAALTFLRNGVTNRDIYLYDTFEGMTPPTEADADITSGKLAAEYLRTHQKDKNNHYWAFAPIEDVQKNLSRTYYPTQFLHFIKGPVEATIPNDDTPTEIALLRLDTDWYSSTKHELEHLYPRLSRGGICIIDDYGTWTGSRQAVNEYIETNRLNITLQSIDGEGYFFIKP